MRGFVVKEGTMGEVIRDGVEWYSRNFQAHEVQTEQIFFLEELVVDPTGISRSACVPGQVTVGSGWAEAGWYGFRRDGWTLMVGADDVQVR